MPLGSSKKRSSLLPEFAEEERVLQLLALVEDGGLFDGLWVADAQCERP